MQGPGLKKVQKNAYLLFRRVKSTSNCQTMGKAKVVVNNEKLKDSSELLRALAHPLRIKILEFIDQNGSINVNKIYNTLKLEQSITSQHLRILRSVGLVETERKGKYIHYRLNYDKISQTLGTIDRFLSQSVGVSDSDDE